MKPRTACESLRKTGGFVLKPFLKALNTIATISTHTQAFSQGLLSFPRFGLKSQEALRILKVTALFLETFWGLSWSSSSVRNGVTVNFGRKKSLSRVTEFTNGSTASAH